MTTNLAVREIQEQDIEALADYWLTADKQYLLAMGADPGKIPGREQLAGMLSGQLAQGYVEKQSYCIIWLYEGKAIGHSNVNKIVFGKEAYMHLHIWDETLRGKGLGPAFIKLTLPYFFNNLQLQKVWCEPYALNPSPNRTLEKTGFQFIKTYTCTPGWINFEQEVNLWEMEREKWNEMNEPLKGQSKA